MAISAPFWFGRRKTNDSLNLPRAVIELYTQEREQLTKSYYNCVLGLRRTKLISVRCQQICIAEHKSCQCTGSVLKQVCQIKHLNEEFKQKSRNQIHLSRKEWNWGRAREDESQISALSRWWWEWGNWSMQRWYLSGIMRMGGWKRMRSLLLQLMNHVFS